MIPLEPLRIQPVIICVQGELAIPVSDLFLVTPKIVEMVHYRIIPQLTISEQITVAL
jgi:hypothetical protein